LLNKLYEVLACARGAWSCRLYVNKHKANALCVLYSTPSQKLNTAQVRFMIGPYLVQA